MSSIPAETLAMRLPDPAPVGLELRLARAPGADAAAEARELGAVARQAREQVLQLGELDLRLPFPRPRALREDVEDELRAIDHPQVQRLFEMPQLGGRQLVVADHQVDALLVAGRREFEQLAASEEGGRVRLRPLLDHPERRAAARGAHEAAEFLERLLGLVPAPLAGREADQRDAFVGIQDVTPGA